MNVTYEKVEEVDNTDDEDVEDARVEEEEGTDDDELEEGACDELEGVSEDDVLKIEDEVDIELEDVLLVVGGAVVTGDEVEVDEGTTEVEVLVGTVEVGLGEPSSLGTGNPRKSVDVSAAFTRRSDWDERSAKVKSVRTRAADAEQQRILSVGVGEWGTGRRDRCGEREPESSEEKDEDGEEG